MRLLSSVCFAAVIGSLLACAGTDGTKVGVKDAAPKDEKPKDEPKTERKVEPKDEPETERKAERPKVSEYKFGEEVREGDLIISIDEAHSGTVAGQYLGAFRAAKMMVIHIRVKNTAAGKIADWPGWQGEATVEDEHGNIFKAVNLRRWSCLPGNNTLGGGWDGDFGARIHPGKVYENRLYYEFAPETTKQITVSVPFKGQTLRFRGRSGDKRQLEPEDDLKAKAGQREKERQAEEKRQAEAKPEEEKAKAEAEAKRIKAQEQAEAKRIEAQKQAERKKAEDRAALLLKSAKRMMDKGDLKKAKERLEEIIKDFPDTPAAKEAKKDLETVKLLQSLDK